MFRDRKEAAKKLSLELGRHCGSDCIILGIPRGGAIIAKYVGDRLNKPWDIIIPKKVGLPFNKEIAMGAVAQDGTYILNEEIIKYYNIPDEYIKSNIEIQTQEIKRRLNAYRNSDDFPDVEGRVVIIVDDGIATGFTLLAAIKSVKNHKPKRIVVGVPVASAEAVEMVGKYVDEIVCLKIPQNFASVGENYLDFNENTDEEIIELFKQKDKKIFI